MRTSLSCMGQCGVKFVFEFHLCSMVKYNLAYYVHSTMLCECVVYCDDISMKYLDKAPMEYCNTVPFGCYVAV